MTTGKLNNGGPGCRINMASIAMIAGSALVNALAFSGTNAAFSLLGDHGGTEMKRDNLAVERLSKVREEYSQER